MQKVKTLKELQRRIQQAKGESGTTAYRPKMKDEQDFMDKHEIELTDDANGNGDEVFKGTSAKYNKRKDERHGYDSPDDQRVHEEADGSDYPHYKKPAKSQDYIGNRSITSKLHSLHKKHNFSGVTFFAAGLDRKGDAPAGVNVKHNSPAHDHPEFKKHLSKLTKFNEEVEQIDEIGDTPKGREMLGNYIDKSARRIGVHSRQAANFKDTASDPTSSPAQKLAAKELGAKQQHKSNMRFKGVQAASSRLAKEEVEQVDERELSSGEMQSREKYVKGMKKRLGDFKKRYGADAKAVMYATATKMAKEEFEVDPSTIELLELFVQLDDEHKECMMEMINDGLRDEILEFLKEESEEDNG